MSFLPLSYSTTSLSTACSTSFTDISDSTDHTSDVRRDSVYCIEEISAGGSGDEMGMFLLGPGWRDHRVPPAERLKHLYRLLEQHYDLTGGDYYGQSALHVCRTTRNSRTNTQREEYPIVCMSYLESTGAGLDFLDNLKNMSPDPMNDLINEAFYRPISLPPVPGVRAAPISTWEIDWSRPLPETAHAYWEMMRLTRTRPLHEFVRAKPVVGAPRVNPQTHYRREDFPQDRDIEENVRRTSGKLRAVLHKVRGFVMLH